MRNSKNKGEHCFEIPLLSVHLKNTVSQLSFQISSVRNAVVEIMYEIKQTFHANGRRDLDTNKLSEDLSFIQDFVDGLVSLQRTAKIKNLIDFFISP